MSPKHFANFDQCRLKNQVFGFGNPDTMAWNHILTSRVVTATNGQTHPSVRHVR
jgi:hypothetical protein